MSSSLRLKIDRLEKENRLLHRERQDQGRRIYHLRIEIGELVRQIKELQDADPTATHLKKEINGLKSNMARIKHNGKRAAAQRDAALERLAEWEGRCLDCAKPFYERGVPGICAAAHDLSEAKD